MKNKSMKRMLMTAATIAICLSLTACGQTGSSNAENSNTETIQSVEMSDANTKTSNDGSEEVIGRGNLGRAIAAHVSFPQCGCELIGLFDSNPFVAGRDVDVDGMPVHHTDTLAGFCHQEHPELAVLCVPENAAPVIAKKLVALGVRAFWNFSHGDLHFDDPAILVENVHLADSLLTLTYGLRQQEAHPESED